MNRIILNFSDFILNETKKNQDNLNYFGIYESDEFKKATYSEWIQTYLKDRIRNIVFREEDVSTIFNSSSDLIEASEKIMSKGDSSNWFMNNISLIAGGTAVAIGIIWNMYKKGKVRYDLITKLKNILPKIKTLDSDLILKSEWDNIESLFDVLTKSSDGSIKHIEKISKKTYYSQINQKGKDLFFDNSEFLGKLKNIFKQQYDILNNPENIKGIYKKKFIESLEKVKQTNNTLKDEIKKKISELNVDINDITIKQIYSKNQNPIVQKDVNQIVSGYKELLNQIDSSNNKFDDIINKLKPLKTSSAPLTTKEYLIAVDSKNSFKFPTPSSDTLKKFSTLGIKGGVVASGIYYCLVNFSDIVKILFPDDSEMNRTSDILENPDQLKNYYAKKVLDSTSSIFGYDKNIGLDLNSIKFKDESSKNDLRGLIIDYIAKEMVSYTETIGSMQLNALVQKIIKTDLA
jgi:hypothetical protein